MRLSVLTLSGLAAVASAKQCTNMTIPVDIEARQGMFNVPNITTDQDVTQFFQNYSSIMGGTNYTAEVLTGYQTVTGTYNISAKFCTPDVMNSTKPVVQVLTHGIGFDKTYWDIPYNNFNYSYENIATESGYCTLAIDRFGIGNSSHADPYQIVQAPAEVGALYQINSMLRNGTLPGVNMTFGTGQIVNVGHSFGSQQSYMLALMYPEVTDALVLTGFSFNGSFADLSLFHPKVARLNQPLRFGSPSNLSALQSLYNTPSANLTTTESFLTQLVTLAGLNSSDITDLLSASTLGDLIAGYNSTGLGSPQDLPPAYITWADASANQFNFLYPAGLDPAMISYSESTKQPFTIGEVLTLGGAPSMTSFTGPVHVVTGREDAIYCGGDCLATGLNNVTSIPESVGMYFPQSSNFSVSIPEAMGHGISVHYGAKAAYQEVQQYLMGVGIVSS